MENGLSLKAIAFICFVLGLFISIFTYHHDYEVLPRETLEAYRLPSGMHLPKKETALTREIQHAFAGYDGAVKLSALLKQDWDYVCMFVQPDASSDFYAGDYAATYLKDNGIAGKMAVPRRLQGKEVSLLLFIKDKTLVYTYYNHTDAIELGGKFTPFMAYAECATREKAVLKTKPWNVKRKAADVADRAIYFDDKE